MGLRLNRLADMGKHLPNRPRIDGECNESSAAAACWAHQRKRLSNPREQLA
jgi:hypothetical protein